MIGATRVDTGGRIMITTEMMATREIFVIVMNTTDVLTSAREHGVDLRFEIPENRDNIQAMNEMRDVTSDPHPFVVVEDLQPNSQ
jgi:hypothetical protein